MDSRVSEDAQEKKNLLFLPGIEPRVLSRPTLTLAITATVVPQIRRHLDIVGYTDLFTSAR